MSYSVKKNSYPSEENKAARFDERETFTLPLNELAKRLKTDLNQGLSQKDGEQRLELYGKNEIPKVRPGFYATYIAPLMNWLIIVYLIVCVILIIFSFFLPEVWPQVILWLSIIAINSTLAIIQQVRAQTKLESLTSLSAPKSIVIRDAAAAEIPSNHVVPGDVIQLTAGDRVPADARLIKASNLTLNEASLTGESKEIEKLEDDLSLEKDSSISARTNMVFLGTYVTGGSASVLVVETGVDTQLGKISKGVKKQGASKVLLLQKINNIAKYLALGVLIYLTLAVTYHVIYLYLTNNLFTGGALNTHLIAQTIVNSLITSMSIMPINIPLLTTIILTTGILAMAKYRVVIRNMNAIESLGRISVICTDKTGTITKNEMTVKWINLYANDSEEHLFGVTGVGFQPFGKIVAIDAHLKMEGIVEKESEIQQGIEVEIKPETSLEYLVLSGFLNNGSSIVQDRAKTSNKKEEQIVYRALGDATDASLKVLFSKSKLDEKAYKSRYEEVYNYPFDSKLKRMTTVFKDKRKGKYAVFTKGATEQLLPLCNSTCNDDTITERHALNSYDKAHIGKQTGTFSSLGYRVISLAFKYLDDLPPKEENGREFFEGNLTYLGFVAITDPPRDGVHESVLEAKGAGITSVMITGDSKETARNIAEQVGIAKEKDLVAEGFVAATLSDEDFLKTSVFARVAPEHKEVIVDRYKKQDRVVAMTGDGVNDTLAISGADVGISMGITGTDAAKETADMIITDDSFNSIVTGVREGRGVFEKIRSVVFFYIIVNVAEALVFFTASFIPDFYLLNTWQRLYIVVLTHSVAPFALIIDRLSKDVMKQKPRDRESISKGQKMSFLVLLLFFALVFSTAYFGTLNGTVPVFAENKIGFVPDFSPDSYNSADWAQAKARTMLLTVMAIAESTLVLSLRRANKPLYKVLLEDNYWVVWFLILLVPLVNIALMYVPSIQLFLSQAVGVNFDIISLTWIDWTIAITLGLIPIVLFEFTKARLRRQGSLF